MITRKRPFGGDVGRILVVHDTRMLGDILLLTPLLAKLREQHPVAKIHLIVRPSISALYQKPPYGVIPLSFDPLLPESFQRLLQSARFDLAVIPGDNRNAWLALALGARWVIGFGGDVPFWKNGLLDELVEYPNVPATWADMVAGIIPGPAPQPFRPAHWPAPDYKAFPMPEKPYCVLHPGASNPLRQWDPLKWRNLADQLNNIGYNVVFSGGAGEESLVSEVNPDNVHTSYAGQLELPQLWQLLAGAALIVCPDTGIAHLGRIVGTPTVTLFGQGSAVLFGAGEFWRESPCRAVIIEPFPCRDMKTLFKRNIQWVRRCNRNRDQCATPRCMQALTVEMVLRVSLEELSKHSASIGSA